MSDLNMPGHDDGIMGDAASEEGERAQKQRGDVAPDPRDEGDGDGDLGLGPALAPPG